MSLQGARQICRFLLSRIATQANELMALDYPGSHPGPKQWLAVILGVVDTASLYLEKSELSSLSSVDAQELINDANSLAKSAYSFTQIMTGVGLNDLPYPVVPPMQRWYDDVKLHQSTFFRTELVVNYEIRSISRFVFDQMRDKAPSLDAALNNILWPMQRFTVPGRAFGMLPHFAIVAHEIGHAIFHQVSWSFPQLPAASTASDKAVTTRLGIANMSPGMVIFRQKIFMNWLQEIVSDAFGHLICGPAFFFAICGLMQSIGGGHGVGESHPSNMFRRELLYKRITQAGGFSEIFSKKLGCSLDIDINSDLLAPIPPDDDLFLELSAELYDNSQISAREQAAIIVEMPYVLQAIVDEVYVQAETHLKSIAPQQVYTPAMYEQDLDDHVDALIAAIPPIEKGLLLNERKPAEFATILNVGWAVLLTKLESIRVKSAATNNLDAERTERLHSLLLKGLELAEARRRWEEV